MQDFNLISTVAFTECGSYFIFKTYGDLNIFKIFFQMIFFLKKELNYKMHKTVMRCTKWSAGNNVNRGEM